MANLRLPTKYDQENIQNRGGAAMLLEKIFHLLVSEEKLERAELMMLSVSYTHLTLPTNSRV